MKTWIKAAAPANKNISLRIVEDHEMQTLNLRYRHKDSTTNVLSFPCELPQGIDDALMGDIVVCAEVIEREAKMQNKEIRAHWAHILIHGVLHLMGYDHINDTDAVSMENLEISILKKLGFANPYIVTGDSQENHARRPIE